MSAEANMLVMEKIQSLLTVLKEHPHALIIALAVLTGLLGGAKIISNGILEANRFQFVSHEKTPMLFDTKSGAVFHYFGTEWSTLYDRGANGEIDSVNDWVRYLKWAEEETK